MKSHTSKTLTKITTAALFLIASSFNVNAELDQTSTMTTTESDNPSDDPVIQIICTLSPELCRHI